MRFFLAGLCCLSTTALRAVDAENAATRFLQQHCADCHGKTDPEADLRLSNLGTVTQKNATVWQRVLAQIATGEMPPKEQPRPPAAQTETAINWIVQALKKAGVKPRMPSGPTPADGNLVDHDRLFSGLHKGPAFSPPRFWRKSQPQYDALMEKLWVIPRLRYEMAPGRKDPEHARFGYSRPFPKVAGGHFSNYSFGVHAADDVVRSVMSAGFQLAERMTSDAPKYNEFLQPWRVAGQPNIRRGSEWKRFALTPPKRPAEFAPFLQADAKPTSAQQQAAITVVFRIFLNRKPTQSESTRYGNLLTKMIARGGPKTALHGLITAVMISPEFIFRMEIGLEKPDEHGRRMLSPFELAYAISYALTDSGPDELLWKAARSGKLKTKADVAREVRRILDDNTIEKHRTLRFFQEFFGYTKAVDVFKDRQRWRLEVPYLIRDADLLIEHVLREDRDVFSKLLTTEKFYAAYPGKIKDPKLLDAIIARTVVETRKGIEKQKARGRKIKQPRGQPFEKFDYSRAWSLQNGRELIPRTVHNDRSSAEYSYLFVYGFDARTFSWSRKQPIPVPGRRAGILTHPAWLVAHSGNFDNDIVRRGHWIREHLLAGKIPDVPIDVEAKVPDEPEHSLRHRMRVTREKRCIRCHRRMDPLGYPFEIYDHHGRFREKEQVGPARSRRKKELPIDSSGEIIASGDKSLDGPVTDAVDLVKKLARSDRVRQSIIRHAFRFWMGRNEMLSDSPTLIAADRAYVSSGGSFKAVLVSLLTSDSFLYRQSLTDSTKEKAKP